MFMKKMLETLLRYFGGILCIEKILEYEKKDFMQKKKKFIYKNKKI